MSGNLADLVIVDARDDQNWVFMLLGMGCIKKDRELVAYMQTGPGSNDPPLVYFENGGILSHDKTEYKEEGECPLSWQYSGTNYQHTLSGTFYVRSHVTNLNSLFRFEIVITDADPLLLTDDVLQMQPEIGLAVYERFRTQVFPRFGYDFKRGLEEIR